MSTEITPAPQREVQYLTPEAERFALQQRMAKLFYVSGLFADIKGQGVEQSIAQAFVKIALGDSMGFSAAESMQGIDIIKNRPAVGAQLRAARMQRNGYTWDVLQCDDKGCRLQLYKGDKKLGEVSYMEADAKAAGLLSKDNWKNDPSSMYFARAITRSQRRYAPGVLSLDVMSTEEAFDAPPAAPPEIPAQAATNAKTAALAAKLESKREQANGKEAEKPAPAPQPAAEPSGSQDLF